MLLKGKELSTLRFHVCCCVSPCTTNLAAFPPPNGSEGLGTPLVVNAAPASFTHPTGGYP